MPRTLAIHWAATTHGTWLHGDERGSWRQGQLIGPDPYLEAETRARMGDDAVCLDEHERLLVANTFGELVRQERHRVFAATIQTTHVHLIFTPLDEELERAIARFKRRSAAAVLKHRRSVAVGVPMDPAKMAGLYSRAILARRQSVPRSLWTAGRFSVFIFDERHLVNAIEYVRDHNRRMHVSPDPFDWIDPLYPPSEIGGERAGRSSVVEVLGI